MKRSVTVALSAVSVFFAATVLYAGGAKPNKEMQALLDSYHKAATQADPGFKGFTSEAGKVFFNSKHTHTETKEVRSCTVCHTTNPVNKGKTVVGKVIEPMAASVNKERFTDPQKVEKWFKRNCLWVHERECTPHEKGNYITYMLSI